MQLLIALERILGFLTVAVPRNLHLVLVFMSNLALPYSSGTGTVFDSPEVDPHNKGTLACVSHSRPDVISRRLIKRGSFVAHRTMPCYQLIHVCVARNGRCSLAVVADRGPLHADIDLNKSLAKEVRHNGLETVQWKKIDAKDRRD